MKKNTRKKNVSNQNNGNRHQSPSKTIVLKYHNLNGNC